LDHIPKHWRYRIEQSRMRDFWYYRPGDLLRTRTEFRSIRQSVQWRGMGLSRMDRVGRTRRVCRKRCNLRLSWRRAVHLRRICNRRRILGECVQQHFLERMDKGRADPNWKARLLRPKRGKSNLYGSELQQQIVQRSWAVRKKNSAVCFRQSCEPRLAERVL